VILVFIAILPFVCARRVLVAQYFEQKIGQGGYQCFLRLLGERVSYLVFEQQGELSP
jgi:hypothetical protein